MKVLRAIGVLVLLLVVALEALRFVPLEALRDPIDRALTSALGKPVQIGGDINIEFDLHPHIELDDVRISDLPGEARFRRFELEFQLLPLLWRVFEISEIVLVGGRIALEGALDPGAGQGDEPPPAEGRSGPVDLGRVDFSGEDLVIVHVSRAGLTTRVHFDVLEVRAREGDRPITLRASGALDGVPFDLAGSLGTPVELAAGGAQPVKVSGQLADLELRAAGRLERPRELAGYEVAISLDAPDLAALDSLSGRTLPAIGPVHLEATLRDSDGLAGLEGIVVRVGDPKDPFEVTARGTLDDLAALDEISFALSLRARDLEVVGQLFDTDLPAIESVTFTGSFRGSNELLASNGFALRLDETTIDGALSGTFVPGKRPTLEARLESAVVHLDDLGIEDPPNTPTRERRGDAVSVLDRRLPFEALPELDAQVQIRVHQIEGEADLMIDELAVDLVATEERLALENLQVNFAGGSVSGEMVVGPKATPPTVSLKLDGSGVHLQKIFAQFERTPMISGMVDASIDVVSGGDTLGAWVGGADGGVTALVRDGRIRTKYATMLQKNLLDAAFQQRGPKQFSVIQCLLADYQLTRGVAEIETLWFETEDTTIRAEGRIDLGREVYDVLIRPTPKKPGLFGYAASVSVTGSFADPQIRPMKESVATSAVKGLLSRLKRTTDPLLNPLTDPILAKFWKRRGGEQGPCGRFVAEES